MSTPYHANLFAHELTLRRTASNVENLIPTLMGARVDLNPHQIDAALFAFRSPLSKGAILADEVGLGKTIEAGIVLAQKWAERKRAICIITPASLRSQWQQELWDKFSLPSVILDKQLLALPGFPWVADLLMSFPEGTNEGYGPIFSDSRADRALVC